MPIQFTQSEEAICFTISGPVLDQIREWDLAVDEAVFKEQLATGLFRDGHPIPEPITNLLQLYKSKGLIRPCYGADARSGLSFGLHRMGDGYTMKVHHAAGST